jgi:hypothetical protein
MTLDGARSRIGDAVPPAEADLFPLTCEWCRNSPATHLLVDDARQAASGVTVRNEHRLCTPCAHQTTILPPFIVGWWLFRLVPDNCEENTDA